MEKESYKDRWSITARGYLLFLLAIVMLFNHYLNIRILSNYIGIGLLVTGGLVIYATFTKYKFPDREIWFNSEGLIDLVAAILILIFSKSGGYAPYLIFGLWAICIGTLQLIKTYLSMRFITNSNWITGSLDALMIILGILIIIHPSPSRSVEHSFMGLYLLVYSIIYMVESFQLKAVNKISL